MKTPQFSKKILGKKLDTHMVLHRISIKFYENGAVIKPIGKQGISIGNKYEHQINNQKAIFLTKENLDFLDVVIGSHNMKSIVAENIVDNNKSGPDAGEWASYMDTK